jgi:hypothetical protein
LEDYLQNIVDERELTIDNVRKYVDDYSIYCHYIGQELELHAKYSSPLREGDNDPSFSLFEAYGKNANTERVYFKDHASIGKGDVFRFLAILLGGGPKTAVPLKTVLKQINCDFQLGLGDEEVVGFVPKIIKKIPVRKERKKIQIIAKTKFSAEYIHFWETRYDIGSAIQNMYNAQEVDYIVYVSKDGSRTMIKPKSLCISYRIGEYYKLYQPYDKDNKFRNDYPANYAEGFLQLDWTRNDYVIITKATKECMLFRQHWNIQAVAGKSENTMIPDFLMQKLRGHFKQVFIWLDPDGPGREAQQKYLDEYDWLIPLYTPENVVEKDPTDYYEVHRLNATTELINTVFRNAS